MFNKKKHIPTHTFLVEEKDTEKILKLVSKIKKQGLDMPQIQINHHIEDLEKTVEKLEILNKKY